MGWVSKQVRPTKEIFDDLIGVFGKEWNGNIGDSTTCYEYFSDYIRDNYEVTLRQCDLLCKMIKQHYQIEKFYIRD